MSKFKLYIIGLANLVGVFTVFQFENRTHLHQRWTTDRPAVEAKIVQNQTDNKAGLVNHEAIKQNVTAVENYSGQYVCASQKTGLKCKPALPR